MPEHQKTQSQAETIYDAAVSARDFTQIVDVAWDMLQKPILVADSMHYVAALSRDLRELYGTAPAWSRLVQSGLVPPARSQEPPGDVFPLSMGEEVEPTLILHSIPMPDGHSLCVMGDIRSGDTILLKLAVCGLTAYWERERQLITALANALYLAYFRLEASHQEKPDDRSRYLLSLLDQKPGQVPALPYGGFPGFSGTGPYYMACLDMDGLGLQRFTLSALTRDLGQGLPGGYLAAVRGSQCVLLIASREGVVMEKELAARVKERRLILGLSRSFDQLGQVPARHREAAGAGAAAARFHRFTGVAQEADFALFEMFESLLETPRWQDALHPDLEKMAQGPAGRTELLQTLFVWLQCGRQAPAAAARLHVHRNTLDNRISRLCEGLQPRWDDGAYVFQLLFSLYGLLRKQDALIWYE